MSSLLRAPVLDALTTRRRVLASLCAGALTCPQFAFAQPVGATRRVGILFTGSQADSARNIAALHEEFREHGLVEGRDYVIDARFAAGQADRLPQLAGELAAQKPAVIIATGAVAVDAVRGAAPSVPIVAIVGELADAGFTRALGRPDRGITGVSFIAASLDPKRLELLAELLPKGGMVMQLSDPSTRSGTGPLVEAAARTLGLASTLVPARSIAEIEAAFAAAQRLRAVGVNVLASPFLHAHRARIIELAARARLPAIYQWPETAEQGGLLAYGPRLSVLYRQLGRLAARILKGARPSDLPVEQPLKFELLLNMRTAAALGVAIPQRLLLRTDKVIE